MRVTAKKFRHESHELSAISQDFGHHWLGCWREFARFVSMLLLKSSFVFRPIGAIVRAYWITLFNFTAR
jgi:hypothetical protein